MNSSTLIQTVSPEELVVTIRAIIREEISQLNSKNTRPRYLTRKEAAEILKISLPTLHEYTRMGILKGLRIGTRILYDESMIRESVSQIPYRDKRFKPYRHASGTQG